MSRNRVCGVIILALLGAAAGAEEPYRPEPFDRYLAKDRGAEINLARSAAPPEVGEKAGVWVLEPSGYREAAPGTNGFVCLVGRGWSAPIRFVSGRPNPEFWSPAVKAPMCLNPEAVGHFMPHVMLYAPQARNAEWGGFGVTSGLPFVGENQGGPHALVIIPVGRWPDGTLAAGGH